MMKKAGITAILISVAMLVCGCSSKPEGTLYPEESVVHEGEVQYPEYQNELDQIDPEAYSNVTDLMLEPGTYITILGKDDEGPFWKAVAAGVKQAQDDINENLGYTGKDAVKVNFIAPDSSGDVNQQVNLLDEELDLYPAALAISILDVQACEVQFDLAYQNGIPIVAFDSGSSYSAFSARVATDNEKAAKQVANQMAERTGEKGQIVIFAHESNSESALHRVDAFKSQIEEKHPDMEVAEVIYTDKLKKLKKEMVEKLNENDSQEQDEEADDASEETMSSEEDVDSTESADTSEEKEIELTVDDISDEEVIDYVLSSYDNITGCYATNGDTIEAALEALERNELNDVVLCGFDINEDVLTHIREGKVAGTILQNPFGMGYATVVAAARSALAMGNQDYIDSHYKWVDAENIDTEEIQKLLY